ncbi:MAG: hypothetical protein K0M45_11075, partial [Candidatus Paracaedibacteraceae bacterium]|nr:hypothetical protein [Candidatus Paracaedibacteraceae bacterium]
MTSLTSFQHRFTACLTLTSFLMSTLSPLQAVAMERDEAEVSYVFGQEGLGKEDIFSATSQGSRRVNFSLSSLDDLLAADEEDLKQKIEAVCKHQPQQGTPSPQASLTGTGLGMYPLSQERALKLVGLDLYGQETGCIDQGSHPVTNFGGVHFKINRGEPLTPALEKAVYLFQMLLVGEGITPSTFLVLKDVMQYAASGSSSEPQSPILTTHLIQASRTAKGMSLLAFFEAVEQGHHTWQDLDPQNFSAQILTSLLIHPFDARSDNFMVVFDEYGKGHIVGIDNDKALSEPVVRETFGQRVAHYAGNKNILYCLQELMEEKIYPLMVDRILAHHPYGLVLKWLQKLEETNVQYQALSQRSPLLTPETLESLEVPLRLAPGKALQLVDQLAHMQAYLRSNPQGLTHNQLFELLHPLLYHHYQALIKHFPNPIDAISRIFPGRGEEKSLQQMLPLTARLKNGMTIYKALQQETRKRLAHKDCTQPTAQAVEELIKQCDLSLYEMTPHHQAELLLIAGQTFPQSLIQAHPSWKDPSWVQKVLRGQMPVKVISVLPHLGIDVKSLSGKSSLLHQALDQPAYACELIDQWLAQGVPIEERDSAGRTVLEVAMEKRLYSVVNHLIHKGAREVWVKVALEYYKSLDPKDQKSRLAFKYLETENPDLLWHCTLEALLPPTGDGKILYGANSAKRVLPSIIAQQLFNHKNQIIRVNNYGRREVGRIERGGYSLYFKQYPEFPGTEQGVSLLMHQLVGHGAPQGELFNIEGIPYYVSQEAKGSTLQDVLYNKMLKKAHTQEHVESYLHHLDPKAVSEMILMAMLVNPEDGKPDNYIVSPFAKDQYRLIGIDNDHAFGPNVAREERGVIPQVKCILYCLDQMLDPVHLEVWEKFRTIDSAQALKRWLIKLSAINNDYVKLFPDPQHVKHLLTQKDKESFIGVAFTPLMLSRLYEKFVRLQHALSKKDPGLTHLEVLKEVEPLLHHRYSRGFEREWPDSKGNRIWQRFITIDGPYYGKDKNGIPLSSHSMASFFTSLKIPLKQDLIDSVRK